MQSNSTAATETSSHKNLTRASWLRKILSYSRSPPSKPIYQTYLKFRILLVLCIFPTRHSMSHVMQLAGNMRVSGNFCSRPSHRRSPLNAATLPQLFTERGSVLGGTFDIATCRRR